MKHIVMVGPKKSELQEVDMIQPNEDQILIQVKYVGVCMSEHYNWSVAKGGETFGHEPMGVVMEVGNNVTDFRVGDRVSGLWGSTLPGSGGFIQYMVADPRKDIVVKLPENVRDEDLILEPLACMMSAVSKARISMPGTKVAVVGCGYMGCGAISLLKKRGAYVVAIDIRPESLEWARTYGGADETYLAEEVIRRLDDHDFPVFDVVMEWGETNESLDLSIRLTKMCGQLCIGAYHTGGKRLVDVQQLNIKAIDCLSVHPREMELNDQGARNAAAMLGSGECNFKGMPVKIYPMDQFDLAQAELETKYGRYMKALIDMTKETGETYIL